MMQKRVIPIAIVLIAALFGVNQLAQRGSAAQKQSQDIVATGQKFLGTLDEAQRKKLIFDFKDADQRKRWSNLPQGIFQRTGLRMGDLTQPQRDAALTLLAAALSAQGYEKILQIVEADEVLRSGSGGKGGGGKGKGKGGGPGFGRDNYFISLLGQPSSTEPWMLQFGGHHLGINVTFAGEHGTLAPSHTGAQPAIYELEGKTVRPLGREVDKAFALMSSLDEAQRKKAILGFEIRDLVLGPGRDGQMIQPEGIKGADLNEQQRGMLIDLASEWIGIMQDAAAKVKLDEMKKDIAETWFAWSGSTEKGAPAYFRLQGPTVFIEFAPQRLGGDLTKHIHTIYRDPTNEYGKKWWK